jgi:hypothetical protein
LTNFKIEESFNRKKIEINENQNVERKIKLMLSANYKNKLSNIDFYIASYSENGVLKNDGIAYFHHSKIKYIYNLEGCLGEVNFFMTPVYKDGTIGSKILAGTKIFNSKGVQK